MRIVTALLCSAALLPATATAQEKIVFAYDSRGRLITAERPADSAINAGLRFDYAWDKANNRLSLNVSGSTKPVPGTPTSGPDTLWSTYGADVIDGLDGDDLIYAHLGGNDAVAGGNGNDAIVFCSSFDLGDSVDGGAGSDVVALQGSYPNLILWPNALTNVETLSALPASDARFGCQSGDPSIGYSYNLTLIEASVAPGTQLTVNAGQLQARETLRLDASAETDGWVRVFGGAGNDTITGSSGNDYIRGVAGADTLRGGPGADTFAYVIGESSGASYDVFADFAEAQDKIDLPGTITGFVGPVSNATLSPATFESDLASAMSSVLTPGKAAFVTTSSVGPLAGKKFLVADANGIAGFQAGADFVFEVPVAVTGAVNFV